MFEKSKEIMYTMFNRNFWLWWHMLCSVFGTVLFQKWLSDMSVFYLVTFIIVIFEVIELWWEILRPQGLMLHQYKFIKFQNTNYKSKNKYKLDTLGDIIGAWGLMVIILFL